MQQSQRGIVATVKLEGPIDMAYRGVMPVEMGRAICATERDVEL